ncbi:uncharacterized protein LOC133872024 [Alnus glutinosa]|uniref:uncharacterized protein LOC133872024 n=1 Tax=Alnus glutinosa TaxID=3517 RepID=UPI002D797C99|nr:uncharacterized protein LOC133872024 [Alnus glutinosa]
MEGSDMEAKDDALKSKTVVRCAKAAFLLSALKSLPNRYVNSTIDDQHEEVKLMRREIGELKMELARERLKNRRIKLCGLMEVVLEVAVVLCVSTFFLMLSRAQSR